MNSNQPQVTSLEINSKKDNSLIEPNNSTFSSIIIPISINNNGSFNNQNYKQNMPTQINQQISKINFEINNEPLNTNSENIILNENEVSNKELNNNKKKIKKNKNKFKICHIEYKKTEKDGNDKKDNKDKIITNRLKHKRKYKPDDIRKKIKSRFHKSIKNIINENLRKAGSKKLFTFLPQVFITSIARPANRYVLNMSLREILQKNFVDELDEKNIKIKKLI